MIRAVSLTLGVILNLALLGGAGPHGSPKHPRTQVWSGSLLLSAFSDGKSEVKLESPGQKPTLKSLPEGTRQFDVYDGVYYVYRVNDLKDKKYYALYRSTDLDRWDLEAFYEGPTASISSIFKVSKDRYFISSLRGFSKGKQASLFALATKDASGRLSVDVILPFRGGEGEVFKEADPEKKAAPMASSLIKNGYTPFLAPAAGPFIRAGKNLVLMFAQKGLIWVWNDDQAALQGPIEVPPDLPFKERERLGPRMEWAILACRPNMGGNLILATRSREAFYAGFDEQGPPGSTLREFQNQDIMKRVDELFVARLYRHPELRWWSLDPSTGKVIPETSPANVSDRFPDIQSYVRFGFYMKPSGDLGF
jgi:hypothetical protein